MRLPVNTAFVVLLAGCQCQGDYPRDAPGATLQQNAVAMRISADTLAFARHNLEKILRDRFPVDADGFIKIHLPEATDGSAETYCDETGTRPLGYSSEGRVVSPPPCRYSVRARDGCLGPGFPGVDGTCPDVKIQGTDFAFAKRETFRSYVRVNVNDLARKLSFEMEAPGPADQGGIRLRVQDLQVDLNLSLYAKVPQLFGFRLGDFTCRYHKEDTASAALTIKDLDISMQPRIETVNGRPSLFATTLARKVDVGDFHLTASMSEDDPACANLDGGIGCAPMCAAMGILLEGTSTVLNSVLEVIGPALPYVVTPLGNVLLAFLWGDMLEIPLTVPTDQLPWAAKGSGSDLKLLASAMAGSFAVTQRSQGALDPTLGMSLPFALGAYAEPAPCVGPTRPPPVHDAPEIPALDGAVVMPDGSEEPYHLALTVSESFLNGLAYSIRNSGMLCAAVGSEPGGLLSTGSFVPTAGLLYLLAPPLSKMAPADAPLFFRTVPGSNVAVRLGGSKELGLDANGKSIKESLITLDLFDTGVEFHLFARDRYVRAFSLQVDLSVGVSVHAATDGKLVISIDSIKADNVRDYDNELMRGFDFSKMTEVLFSLLANQLNGGALSFDVPLHEILKEALGDAATARLLDIRTEGTGSSFLSAFVKLCTPEDEHDPSQRGCYIPQRTVARDAAVLSAVQVPSSAPLGTIELAVEHTAPGAWEYQYAVDSQVFGRFTQPRADGRMRVEHPLLRISGAHQLTLRARPIGAPVDIQAHVTQLSVLVDPSFIVAEQEPPPANDLPQPSPGCGQTDAPSYLLALLAMQMWFRKKWGQTPIL